MKYKEEIVQFLYDQISESKNKLEDEKFKLRLLFVYKKEYQNKITEITAVMNTATHLLMTSQLSRALKYVYILSCIVDDFIRQVYQESDAESGKFLKIG